MNTVTYASIRKHLRTGDLICFWGKGLISNGIRLRTMFSWPPWGPNPSHIAVVLNTTDDHAISVYDIGQDIFGPSKRVNLIESTSLDGKSGVVLTRLSQRLATYQGTLAVARVRESLQRGGYAERAQAEGMKHLTKGYDLKGALGAGLRLIRSPDSADKLFCSELAARMHKAAGWLPVGLNPDEVTPKDMLHYTHVSRPQRLRRTV